MIVRRRTHPNLASGPPWNTAPEAFLLIEMDKPASGLWFGLVIN